MASKVSTSKKDRSLDKIFAFIIESGSLMFMPRTHIRQLINTFDTVSSHSHHAGLIAYSLARIEGLSHGEGLKALAMGILHDLPEARTSDLDFVAKHYATTNEEKAIDDLLVGLPFGEDLKQIFQEYNDRETLVSKCAKDADTVEQTYQVWVLSHMGNKMAERWFTDSFKDRVPHLRTKSAKKLMLKMKNSHPHQWWYEALLNQPTTSHLLNGER